MCWVLLVADAVVVSGNIKSPSISEDQAAVGKTRSAFFFEFFNASTSVKQFLAGKRPETGWVMQRAHKLTPSPHSSSGGGKWTFFSITWPRSQGTFLFWLGSHYYWQGPFESTRNKSSECPHESRGGSPMHFGDKNDFESCSSIWEPLTSILKAQF